MLYIKCSLLNDECESFSPKGTLSEEVTSELNEASPPTKCNTIRKFPLNLTQIVTNKRRILITN
jgi:hypothetical protein